ncbi:Adenylate cyclase [Diplonema papillatum]|nr:Adenylate cyclase [Diplonema papillatum]
MRVQDNCTNAVEWVVRGTLRPTDDELTVLRKTLVAPLSLLLLFVTVLLSIMNRENLTRPISPYVFTLAFTTGTFCYVMLFQSMRYSEFTVVLIGYTFIVMMWDLEAINAADFRCWPMFVLIVDLMLVSKVPDKHTVVYLGVISLWLILVAVEDMTRFGLYDLFATEYIYEQRIKSVMCDKPPCARSLERSISTLFSSVTVFMVDFLITRDFSKTVRAEKHRMQAAVDTADKVARALGDFDLDGAADVLDENEQLPERLSEAFLNILFNLKAYRPFLPDALFEELRSRRTVCQPDSPSALAVRVPPGSNTGKACLVFTDIVKSTATWEACPEGMKKGLKLHNEIIRQCILQYSGYEVKTIGDAFMVAFETVSSALNFGLDVQERLLDAPWPPALYDLPQCSKDVDGIWAGIRVRIGVHQGDVELETNGITGAQVVYLRATCSRYSCTSV